jgi:hypothetical protein
VFLNSNSESDPDQRGDARLYLCRKDGLLHLEFNGVAFDDVYTELLSLLGEAGVSDLLGSLSLREPDQGANGTRNWSLTPLVENTGTFPHLRSFFVEPTDVADHNRSIMVLWEFLPKGGYLVVAGCRPIAADPSKSSLIRWKMCFRLTIP